MPRLALHWQIIIAMVIGAVIGLALNFTSGDTRMTEPVKFPSGELQPYGFASAVKVNAGEFWAHDRTDRVVIQITNLEGTAVKRVFVGPLSLEAQKKPAGEQLVEIADWPEVGEDSDATITELIQPSLAGLKKSDPQSYALFQRHGRSMARSTADLLKMFGDLFLRLLKMVSVPLIIFSLSTGVLGLGQADRLGKMFGRTVTYYVATSMLAICTGLLMVNIIQPGVDRSGEQNTGDEVAEKPAEQGKKLSTVLFEQVENMIPPNPAKAVSDGQFLGIIAFTLAFAIFAILVGGKTADTMQDLAQAGFEVMMKMTMAVIKLAPAGVLCLMLFAAATQGLSVFGRLGVALTSCCNPDGSTAVVAANRHDAALRYALCVDERCRVVELPPRSISTFVVDGADR